MSWFKNKRRAEIIEGTDGKLVVWLFESDKEVVSINVETMSEARNVVISWTDDNIQVLNG